MPASHLKEIAKQVCPPLLWKTARGLYVTLCPKAAKRARAKRDRLRYIHTIEEIDEVFAEATRLASVSDAACRGLLESVRFEPDIALPSDPDSPEYRRVQMGLYELISGQSDYRPQVNELLDIDFDQLMARPHPYWSRNSQVVGQQLMAIGCMIRAMDMSGGESILEFGPGSGTSTLEFAKMGHPVTAVDLNPLYTRVVDARARQLGLTIDTVCSEMLAYEPGRRFDRIVFYECFHHCSDHLRLMGRLDGLLNPGGTVVFAGEPIDDAFPWPWGLRMDGISLWCIRTAGWLELGFQAKYFTRSMARHGWTTETVKSSQALGWVPVYVARRTAEAEGLARAAG
jgi:2-polyprenyl-3-methyl-5-hydroxy-6-metoxy-1,4-benzoquinol methylase